MTKQATRDSELPRDERFFARIPTTTKDKIADLAKRWGSIKSLSPADVLIELVDRAYKAETAPKRKEK